MISSLVAQLKVDGGEFADNQTPPPDEQARGQLLRALASDAIRGALQRHFGVRLAFQNCHRVAVFPLDSSVDETLGPLHLGTGPAAEPVAGVPGLLTAVSRRLPLRTREVPRYRSGKLSAEHGS